MKILLMAAAMLLVIPVLQAQQAEPNESAPQLTTQENTVTSPSSNSLPENLKPGHPLDPADVDVLTGKKDREIAASRRTAYPVIVSEYGMYGDVYAINGRLAGIGSLPLRRVGSPYYFFNAQPGGFGRQGLRGPRR